MSDLPGVFIASADENLAATIDTMNKLTQEWTMRAARGECSWVCSDCCMTFPAGMPDACAHGQQVCTDIITRDKAEAAVAVGMTPNVIWPNRHASDKLA